MKSQSAQFAVLTFMMMHFLTWGCANSNTNSGDAPGKKKNTESLSSAPAWTLRLVATCSSGNPDDCLAGHGLSVSALGTYSLGPAPTGEVLSGQLERDEFETFRALVEPLLSQLEPGTASRPTPQSCPGTLPSDPSQELTLIRGNISTPIFKTAGNSICAHALSEAQTQALKSAIERIAEDYYPTPFPADDCNASIGRLEALYTQLRVCEKQSDCYYINSMYQPVPSEQLDFLILGDCGSVSPLLVANRESTLTQQDTLRDLARKTHGACVRNYDPVRCTGFVRFQPTQPAPECIDQVCRVGTSALSWFTK